MTFARDRQGSAAVSTCQRHPRLAVRARVPALARPEPGDVPRGGPHLRLLRRRHALCDAAAPGVGAVREHEIEPVPGLPENAAGRRAHPLAGQRRAGWRSPSGRCTCAAVAIYFALLFALDCAGRDVGRRFGLGSRSGLQLGSSPVASPRALGFARALACLARSAAVYTITNRRVVMRFGIALPMIRQHSVRHDRSCRTCKAYGDGTRRHSADAGWHRQRQSIVVLWPHVRPWRTVEPATDAALRAGRRGRSPRSWRVRCVPSCAQAQIAVTACRASPKLHRYEPVQNLRQRERSMS